MHQSTVTVTVKTKLSRLKKPPKDLSVLGTKLTVYDKKTVVAIVGTRKITPYGKLITHRFAEELARVGIVVVSGLAIGVDAFAHKATLEAGGLTIAVLPSGVDNVYPAVNRQTAAKILATGGSLVSEYPSKHQPRVAEFLERNRIIAALSDLVLIPEAASHSGSLNTANHAKTMGIPVAVIPGNITSPMSMGTNQLLKTGALAVTEPRDVLNIVGINPQKSQLSLNLSGRNEAEISVLKQIEAGIIGADEIQEAAKLDTADFQTALTILEIDGLIYQTENGNWQLR